MAARTRRRAWCSRLLKAAWPTPAISAASCVERPSTSRSTIAVRSAGGRSARARPRASRSSLFSACRDGSWAGEAGSCSSCVPIGTQELQLPASPAQDPSRQAENSELRLALGRALADLPPALRTAIVLRDVEGLSTQEAAEIAGVGQAAFKSRLHQARLRVRAAIGDEALVTAGG